MSKQYTIAIIDYHMGNIFSLENLLNMLGYKTKVTSDRNQILSSDAAILPGIGGFPSAMKYIEELDLSETIKDYVDTGKPIMGICLGFQLLFDESEEMGKTFGLGVLPGKVESFTKYNPVLRVPHVGWNAVEKQTGFDFCDTVNFSTPLLDNEEYFYFLHSYIVNPCDKSIIFTETKYFDVAFCSSIIFENIFACQFHPEKSGVKGIKIFQNFFDNIE